MKEKWRLVLDGPGSGAMNMALDEALLVLAERGQGPLPVVRLYGWIEPTISVGFLQDASPFLTKGLPIVRRITGGRALIHDQELTYAVVADAGSRLYAKGLGGSYAIIGGAIVAALCELGVEAGFARPSRSGAYRKSAACFASSCRHEVMASGRKIAAGAQRRTKRGLLQHGSIMLGMDRLLWEGVFGRGLGERSCSLHEALGRRIERAELQEVVVRKMAEALGVSFVEQGLTVAEEALAARLYKERYSRAEWNVGAWGGVRKSAKASARPLAARTR